MYNWKMKKKSIVGICIKVSSWNPSRKFLDINQIHMLVHVSLCDVIIVKRFLFLSVISTMKFQLDTLLETLGKPGKYQLGIFFLLACNYFPLVFNIVIMGFFGYSPKHSCISDIYGQSGRNGSAVNGSLAPRLDACSSTYFLSGGINKTVTCANDPNSHWEFYTEEREATIVSEVQVYFCFWKGAFCTI